MEIGRQSNNKLGEFGIGSEQIREDYLHLHHHHQIHITTATTSFNNHNNYEFILRFMAALLTLVATVILGVDKQTTTVPVQLTSTLPPLRIPVTAKWQYLSVMMYFVVANAIACSYGAISLLILAIFKGNPSSRLRLMMIVMDVLMVALLFSSFGGAAAVGVIGRQGNQRLKWDQICNVFGRFCSQGGAALLLSLLGAILFLSLLLLIVLKLQRK